jgi:hypothetical protein
MRTLLLPLLLVLGSVGCATPYAEVVSWDRDNGIFVLCGTGGLKEKAAEVCPTAQVHQCGQVRQGTEVCCGYTCEVAR